MSKPRSSRRRRLLLLTLVGVGAYVLRQATRDQGGSYVPPGDDTLEVPDDADASDLRRSAPAASPAAAASVPATDLAEDASGDEDDDVAHEHHLEVVPDEEIDVDGPGAR